MALGFRGYELLAVDTAEAMLSSTLLAEETSPQEFAAILVDQKMLGTDDLSSVR